MPLKNKYLKYSPEITLEIFTLVWDKFEQSGYRLSAGINTIFENWNTWIYIIIEDNNICTTNTRISNLSETTVQEILGYDPFVKEDFVLPEKWCVKASNKEEDDVLIKWRGGGHSAAIGESYMLYCKMWSQLIYEEHEITFDQFKKYVLKEQPIKHGNGLLDRVEKDWSKTSKEELLEEAKHRYPVGTKFKGKYHGEQIVSNIPFISDGDILVKSEKSQADTNYTCYLYEQKNNKWAEIISLPENKVESKSIEKWSVGSYVVFLARNLQNNGRAIGDISKIIKYDNNSIYFKDGMGNDIAGQHSIADNLRWFATEAESEEFVKTLKTKKLLTLNNWYQSGNHIVYLYERNKVYGFHHNNWFTSEGFNEYNLKYIDSYSVEEKFTEYIKNNYLIGQSFVDLVNNIDFQIKSYDLNFGNKTTQIYIPVKLNDLKNNKTARIFDKGVWAKHSSTKSNKQAVHCKTQEEWDFVLSKLRNSCLLSKQINKFIEFSNNYKHENGIAINVEDCAYCGIGWYKSEGYQILSFQEWCDLNGYKMENKLELEVGKWYEIIHPSYCKHEHISKFKEFKNDRFYYSEKIISKQHKFTNDYHIYPNEVRLCNIEEIQQYLPDNHPDKIKVNKEFEVGDWVIVTSWYYDKNIKLNQIAQIKEINLASLVPYKLELSIPLNNSGKNWYFKSGEFRHTTLEEIQNYKDREAFNSYNLDNIKLGKTLSSKINPCQAIGRLDRSNTSIFPTFEEKPSIEIKEIEINKNYFIEFKDPYIK